MPPQPQIAIYFTDPDADDYPFSDDDYRQAYGVLADLLKERGTASVVVRGQETYLGGNTFNGCWRWNGNDFVRENGRCESSLIFNRGRFAPDGTERMLNDITLNTLCDDKAWTYRTFEEFSPKSLIVRSASEVAAAETLIPSSFVVAKPNEGLGGDGILIGPKEEILAEIPSFPYILQEFVDTSGGIPGIAKGMHDFRMVSIDGEVFCVFIREPRKGSYLANVAQGGHIWELAVDRIPDEAMAMFRIVDKELSRFPHRIYCVDVARGKDGRWKLIELNAQAGLSYADYSGRNDPTGKAKGAHRYFHRLADLLAECARN